jgi:predicted TIM-barrel fold metal-dependent hydrolase
MHIHLWPGAAGPRDMIRRFDKAGICGGAVFSEAPVEMNMGDAGNGEKRLERIVSFTGEYPDRLFPILWIHPDEKDVLPLVKTAAEKGIRGFKIICNNFYVYEQKSMELLRAIAETGLPVCFHAGILWDPGISGEYNRPLNWESLIGIPGIRFSLAHCAWPWYDECIALYSKFLYLANQNSFSGEMYLDLTPGTPMSYRRDLLTKLLTSGFDVDHHMLFGTDCNAGDYRIEWAQKWIQTDNAVYDELGLDSERRQRIFAGNTLRFFGISGESYRYRPAKSDGS